MDKSLAIVQQAFTVIMVLLNLLRMELMRKEISSVLKVITVRREPRCQLNVLEELSQSLLEVQRQEMIARAVLVAITVWKESPFKESVQEVTIARIDTPNHSLASITPTIITRDRQVVLPLVSIAQLDISVPGKERLTMRISHVLLAITAKMKEQLVHLPVPRELIVIQRVSQALAIVSNAHKVTIVLQLRSILSYVRMVLIVKQEVQNQLIAQLESIAHISHLVLNKCRPLSISQQPSKISM
jgi:hypothetical protein